MLTAILSSVARAWVHAAWPAGPRGFAPRLPRRTMPASCHAVARPAARRPLPLTGAYFRPMPRVLVSGQSLPVLAAGGRWRRQLGLDQKFDSK